MFLFFNLFFLAQRLEMMSVLYLMCACTLSHTQTHRSCKVFRASEKESGPVARQPQPPCSLVHFKLKDTNTQEKTVVSHVYPLCAA